ncbi:MAG: transcription termination/antitermination NusG family protein [Bacteroidota bacterium]
MEQLFYPLKVRGGQEKNTKRAIEERIKTANLQDLVSEVHLMPYDKVVVNKKGKKEFRERFLSYLYIEGDCTNPLLRENIIQVEGVLGWVGIEKWGPNQEPYPIKAEELNKMFNKVAQKQTTSVQKTIFKEGDKIIIKDPNSLFKGSDGQIREIIRAGGIVKSLKINLNLFGSEHQANVTLTPDQVELAPKQK